MFKCFYLHACVRVLSGEISRVNSFHRFSLFASSVGVLFHFTGKSKDLSQPTVIWMYG